MELEITNYEQSIAIKKLGFPQFITSLTSFYYKNDKTLVKKNYDYDFIPDYPMKCVAPSLELVAKWLREEKRIHVTPLLLTTLTTQGCYNVIIYRMFSYKEPEYKTIRIEGRYEEALSAGIDKAIEMIKGNEQL